MLKDPVADIKARLQIEEVVRPYVELKRSGRSYKGLCPWHAERTPSFHVSPEKQMAYCFGCGKGGDMFTFIQETEHLDFKGALEMLAERAGLDLSQYKDAPLMPRVSKGQKDTLYTINTEAAKFYQNYLTSTKEGKKVLTYLEGRGFDAETIDEFGLGLAPDSFEASYDYFVQKKCSKADLLELGLLAQKDTTSDKVYDKFRLRLMFPIRDHQGHLVGFGGRALKEGDQPKYMNSPDSVVYHKGDILYGFYRAKKTIREEDLAVVVEGYMDVMASHQAGVKNVVATSGTALTEAQLKLIKRITSNVAFAFDTDAAGEEALWRAAFMAQRLAFNVHVIHVPYGKDPADCVKEDPELWIQAVKSAPFYLDYYLGQLIDRFDLTSIQEKEKAARFFLPFLRRASSLERDHYIKQLGFLLKSDPTALYDLYNGLGRDEEDGGRDNTMNLPEETEYSTQDYFVGLLLRFAGQVTEEAFSIPDEFFEEPLKSVYRSLSSQYNNGACLEVEALFQSLDESLKSRLDLLMLLAESRNADLSEDALRLEIIQVAKQLDKTSRTQRARHLMFQIEEAKKQKDSALERKLFQEYSQLFP